MGLAASNCSSKRFINFGIWPAIFLVSYLAVILAVLVHEAIGHGLTAKLLGGSFYGVGISWDGMGWANVDISMLEPWRQALVYAGGFVATISLSIIFLVAALVNRHRIYVSITTLLFAFAFMSDSVSYFLWDAIFVGGRGDVSKILQLFPSTNLRIGIIVVTSVVGVAGVVLFNVLMMSRMLNLFKRLGYVGSAYIIAVMLFFVQITGWLTFDWSLLVPVEGINIWANTAHITITLISVIGAVVKTNRS